MSKQKGSKPQDAQRTPGPWVASGRIVYGGTGARITVADTTCAGSLTREEDEANAAFIVRACNAHAELLAALRDCITDAGAHCYQDGRNVALTIRRMEEINRTARAAIAKAEGRS